MGTQYHRRGLSRFGRALTAALLIGTTGIVATSAAQADPAAGPADTLNRIVPAPVKLQPLPWSSFRITDKTKIYAQPGSGDAASVGDYLASVLRPATGYRLPVVREPALPVNGITLLLAGADAKVGDQGYQLDVTPFGILIRANKPAGLFAAVQTLRQLLPASIESTTVQRGPWKVPGVRVLDYPRFAYRGAHLDVSRHFFGVDKVKRYIDQIALYKVNQLHLHLTDDQGWRLEIKSWPKLATYGGSTQVGGGPGGYYTQQQYSEIIAYAASRHITVIPEIDMPGHTNAALASYAELNCNGVAPPLYTGIEVGFSSFCINKDITYKLIDDVIRELAALTPGPYIHIGGDEAHATSEPDYNTFITKVLPIVAKYGKKVMGWHEFIKVHPSPETSAVPQYWGTTPNHAAVAAAAQRGNKVLLSPANKSYLDMKYNPSTPLGLSWAGLIEVKDAYEWNPGSYLNGVSESAVLGVEAPLWSETLKTSADIEFMAFPRLPAIAELGWSPQSTHNWAQFQQRLAAQGPRWTTMGVNFYPSTQIPWPAAGADKAESEPVR